MTYRYYGHHQGDDTHRYRTNQEEDAARERDCIRRFRLQLLGGTVSEEDLNALDASNRQKIDEAVSFAEVSPLPHPDELLTQVYVAAPGGDTE